MKTMRARGLWLLLAPLALALAACEDDEVVGPAEETVVDVAVSVNEDSGEFSTLIAALAAADLVETLEGEGPFTVFAPTDAAFAAIDLDAAAVAELPMATLRDILLFHVAPGRLAAAEVTSRTSLTMANGGMAAIAVSGATATIEGARIVQTDVAASNGVIHVIDAVILP